MSFRPGQYMEWTFDHRRADDRGKRRYFTLASSPTETAVQIGIKFAEQGSSFKEALRAHARQGTPMIASQIAGDFTLPRDPARKLAFIAGGIGVTPFRSMAKYLTDRREDRDIVLLYANTRYEELMYADVFGAARRTLHFRPVYVLSDASDAPTRLPIIEGRIDATLIEREIPDFHERLFYVSGSPGLVRSVVGALRGMGVKRGNIKTDAFSGL